MQRHSPGLETGQRDIRDYPMPRSSSCPFAPPPDLLASQRDGRLVRVRLWDGSTPWLVTRYEDQRALLADSRISADVTLPHYPHHGAGQKETLTHTRTFITMDDPEHARQRRMVTAPFSIRRVEALRPAIQKIADGLIDDMLAGPRPADLVEAFALPLPSLVICELLGVPYADHGFFQGISKILISRDSTMEQARTAQRRLVEYLGCLLDAKSARPGDDLLSELTARILAGELTRPEAVSMGRLLIVAAHETTANMIALGTLALLEHPAEMADLAESADESLIAGTVEELLRYLSIVHTGRRRVALADIEVGGQTIRAGEGLVLPNDLANWDPSAFPQPDVLDIQRSARHHVAFGFGVHQCLGQPLARVELQVAYGTLCRRIPAIRLATKLAEVPFKCDGTVYGVHQLLVSW